MPAIGDLERRTAADGVTRILSGGVSTAPVTHLITVTPQSRGQTQGQIAELARPRVGCWILTGVGHLQLNTEMRAP